MNIKGLTDKEVKESRAKYGSNEIPDSEPTTFWQEFKETFQDPMIRVLLVIAGLMIVMFFFGYAEIYEPTGTIVAVLIVAFVTAKTGVARRKVRRKISVRSTEMVSWQSLMSMMWLSVIRCYCSRGIRFLRMVFCMKEV